MKVVPGGKVCSHGNKEGTMIGYIVSHIEHYHPLPIFSVSHSLTTHTHTYTHTCTHTPSSPLPLHSNTIAQHSSITHTKQFSIGSRVTCDWKHRIYTPF